MATCRGMRHAGGMTAQTARRQSLSETVASNILAEAGRRRMSQSDLGQALGLTRQAVSDRYRGRVPWTLDEVERAAAVFGVPLPYLLSIPWLPRLDSNQQPSDYVSAQVIDLENERLRRQREVAGDPLPGQLAPVLSMAI